MPSSMDSGLVMYAPTPRYSHWYVNQPESDQAIASVRRAASLASERGPQWVHHHPHGHLCDHRCAPVGSDG